jgi:hypothetical protein
MTQQFATLAFLGLTNLMNHWYLIATTDNDIYLSGRKLTYLGSDNLKITQG